MSALPRLHAVTDDRVIARGDVLERAAALSAAAGPALAVHLRVRASGARIVELARGLAERLTPNGSCLVVNDRADVARAAGARAVVSGRGGLGVADIRRVAPEVSVGRSVHDADEVRAARAEGADFLVAGPVFRTASHPELGAAGAGLVRAAAATGRKVIAIGGITPERTGEATLAGAWGVAAIRALFDAAAPAAAVRAFLAALPADETLALLVNGEARRARAGTTLAALLTDLSLDPRAVVVEHNRRIVRREQLATTPLGDGDRIELVHFVGGG